MKLSNYASALGKKGGKSKSLKKRIAARFNLMAAHAKTRGIKLVPECTTHTGRHRFIAGQCSCGYRKE